MSGQPIHMVDGQPGISADAMETMTQCKLLFTLALNIEVEPLQELIRAMRLNDTITPLFNPTQWIRTHDVVDETRQVLEAFLKLRLLLDTAKTKDGGS